MIDNKIKSLKIKSLNIRINILKAIKNNNSPHIASSYSIVDILNYIYYNKKNNEKIILSKGHASSAFYATLVEYNFIEKEEFIENYSSNGSKYSGHVTLGLNKEISATSGALGHGLSIGVGIALGNKNKHVYVILGDGELNEGSIWEAFIFISHHKIKNITIIIDNNKLQGCGNTKEIIDTSYMDKISNIFNFNTIILDGNNYKSIINGFNKFDKNNTNLVIANTKKGFGISFMENNLKFHYISPNNEEYVNGLNELENKLGEIQ